MDGPDYVRRIRFNRSVERRADDRLRAKMEDVIGLSPLYRATNGRTVAKISGLMRKAMLEAQLME
jgi:hypothetical protein